MNIELLVEPLPDGTVRLAAPLPGVVRLSRRIGDRIGPGALLGVVVRDQRSYRLLVPPEIAGQLREVGSSGAWSCDYGAQLAVVAPIGTAEGSHPEGSSGSDRPAEDGSTWTVTAPTHGTFYRAGGASDPPFAEVADTIQPGQTIGLIEVMKCFSPLTMTGAAPGVVLEFLVENGAEVVTGQPVARFRRA